MVSQDIAETVNETVEDTLPKRAKLQQAREAVFLDDLNEIAADERETVDRYREMMVFRNRQDGREAPPKSDSGDEEMGRKSSILIADNIHINDQQKVDQSTSAPAAAPAVDKSPASAGLSKFGYAAIIASSLLGAGGIGAAVASLLNRNSPQVQSADTDTDTWGDLTFGGKYDVIKD